MFCTDCGSQILEDASFCTGCGRIIAGRAAPPVAPRMTYGESFRAGWLFTWRGVVASFVFGIASFLFVLVFIGLLGSAGIAIRGTAETAFSWILGGVVAIFVIFPLLVRMMLDKEFRGFAIDVVRPKGQEGELTLSFTESLRARWLLVWRSSSISLACGAVLGLIVGIVGALLGAAEAAIQSISSSLGALLGMFLVTPWVVRMMTRKQFRGFHLEVRRP